MTLTLYGPHGWDFSTKTFEPHVQSIETFLFLEIFTHSSTPAGHFRWLNLLLLTEEAFANVCFAMNQKHMGQHSASDAESLTKGFAAVSIQDILPDGPGKHL
jgi:hypothetical protein